MVNRPVFSSLLCKVCKTFCAALFLSTAAYPSRAQVLANTSGQPAVARASFGAPAEKLKLAGVHNAGKVSDALLRGAQPSAQGLAELKKLGVTTIVDLRGNSGPVAWERAQAEALGIRFVNIPVRGWSPPGNAQVAEFLKLFQQDPTQKIFVHCYYGEDRTGVMVAAYRIAQQNWTADQAMMEMDSFGFHYHLYRAMKSYVRRFPATFGGDPAFAPLHTATAQR
jgi:tyrosine-protein phosphatase SIW14